MFKYLRNINGSSAPVVGRYYSTGGDDSSNAIEAGSIFSVGNGIVSMYTSASKPLYLAYTSYAMDESGFVTAIPLAPGSVLEADIDPTCSVDEYCVGNICGLGVDENTGKGVCAGINEESVFEIIDVSNIKSNKVIVRVI